MSPDVPFERIWGRIVKHAGQTMETITRKPFTYQIQGNGLVTTRTHFRLSKSDFEKAYQLLPLDGPGPINQIVRGASYIWAILHDPRISRSHW